MGLSTLKTLEPSHRCSPPTHHHDPTEELFTAVLFAQYTLTTLREQKLYNNSFQITMKIV